MWSHSVTFHNAALCVGLLVHLRAVPYVILYEFVGTHHLNTHQQRKTMYYI